MIDITKAKKVFKKYVQKYDIQNGMITLKIVHTYEVVKLSEYIAKKLNLNKEDIELAKLIALLHDIGRFEQIRIYNSFEDSKTVDHAELGLKILFKENLIRQFIKEDKYDNLIYKAIKNHNKYKIEKGLSERELLHAKIIRDADKTDIYRVALTTDLEEFDKLNEKEMENDIITPYIFEEIKNNHLISNKDTKNSLDTWLTYPAYIFDYNFLPGLEYISKKRYIEKMLDRINYKNANTKVQIEQIKKICNNYIKYKIYKYKKLINN